MITSATRTQAGLCMTCNEALTCTFPKLKDQPIIFCEEFDGYLRNGHEEHPDVKAILKHVTVKPRTRKIRVFQGLCSNCEIREACVFPRMEGGIWHCEEYR